MLGILLLTSTVLVTSIWFLYESSAKTENQNFKSKVHKQKEKALGNKTYKQFREDVLRQDRELIAKYKAMKQQRRSTSNVDPESYRKERVEKQISELENSLKLYKNSASKKGTVGWGIKQDLERLKREPTAL